jgi:hypothetical protein
MPSPFRKLWLQSFVWICRQTSIHKLTLTIVNKLVDLQPCTNLQGNKSITSWGHGHGGGKVGCSERKASNPLQK